MLVVPNTTTTADETTVGAAVFPPDAGALTPFTAGFLFVANASAQISIRKGPNSPGTWTPYALVSPTLVPLSTDRGGRKTPDFIWGVKAIDGVPGTHAQVFGALFQAGEAGFVPSAQFGGTIGASGGFSPATNLINGTTGRVNANGTLSAGTGFTPVRNAQGDYTVTYTNPFAAAPLVFVQNLDTTHAWIEPIFIAFSQTGFEINLRDTGNANQDGNWEFLTVVVQ